jgi:hypothetical protein
MSKTRALHIVQGGVENKDTQLLERAAREGMSTRTWIVPKRVSVGDDVVVYVSGFGFFATARIISRPKPRSDWRHRYGAALGNIKLITPPISLTKIRRDISGLNWARYPRSITTPELRVAEQVQTLINSRRAIGVRDLDEESVEEANLEELRRLALLKAKQRAPVREQKRTERIRARAIHLYVLQRAKGKCEACRAPAPFRTQAGRFYLEPHHTLRLADDGPDHPRHVIGLCPNCHRRAHHADDAVSFNHRLIMKLKKLEPGWRHR